MTQIDLVKYQYINANLNNTMLEYVSVCLGTCWSNVCYWQTIHRVVKQR